MTRRIHCESCGCKPLHPEDVLNGIHQRVVRLEVKKPAVHIITETVLIKGKVASKTVTDVPSIRCDLCGVQIPDRTPALAIRGRNSPIPIITILKNRCACFPKK